MKPKPATAPQTSSLDWPREAGLADEFLQKIETKLRRKKRRRRAITGAASLLVFGLFTAFWAVPYVRDTGTLATVAAHQESFTLADGSKAELNARTQLKTDFRYGRRTVSLTQGEAFFSVVSDPAHPFLVQTPAGTVRVTGTKFNVRSTGPAHVEVTLLEGAVLVQGPQSDSIELSPGEQFDSSKSVVRGLSAVELENALAWRDGQLALDGLTLAEAAERLGAFHGVRFIVSPDVAQLRPGGSFPINDLPKFLKAFSAVLSVRIIPQEDGSYRIIPR